MLMVQGHKRKQLFLNTSVLRILQNKVQRYLTELWRVRMLEQSYEKTIIKLKRAWELLVYLLIKMKNIKWRSYCTVCLEGYVSDIDTTVTSYQYWACYMYMEYTNHWLYQLNKRKQIAIAEIITNWRFGDQAFIKVLRVRCDERIALITSGFNFLSGCKNAEFSKSSLSKRG